MSAAFRSLLGLAAALLVPAAPAFAQAGPSAYTSAARYDGFGRVTGTISPDPDGAGPLAYAAVRNSYDGAGRLIRVEQGQLSAWQSEAVAPAAWSGFTIFRTLETSYDGAGRKLNEAVREGAAGTVRTVTQYSYNLDGRLECTAVRMNPASFGALPDSACTLATAGSYGPDRITRNVYNAAGERVQVREGVGTADEGTEATWAYNLNGQVTQVIDGNGNRAELHYDGHGRQDRWTFPSTTRPTAYNDATQAAALASAGSVNADDYEGYSYDPNGNRTNLRKRDTRNIAFEYDALNRVTAKTYPNGGASPVYYSYNLQGLQLTARFGSQAGAGVTNSYDGFGRLLTHSTNMGGTARTLTYLHDRNGNRTRITHPDGPWFDLAYDGLNRPIFLSRTSSFGLSFTSYLANGLPSGTSRGNNSLSPYDYDGIQRLNYLGHWFPNAAGNGLWTYQRNSAGQIASTTSYADSYSWTGHYAVNRAYTADGLNRYSQAGNADFAYDLNGNLITETSATGTRTWLYDVENRLVGAPNNVTLSYDPLGRLYQLAVGGTVTTTFLYDGDALIAEYNNAGVMTRRYVHWAGADVPVVSYPDATLANPSYLYADHQGSIVAVSNANGQVIQPNSYDEYGIPAMGNVGRFQYTGQAWIPELGMYHYKARVYSPTLGRFLQVDPVGYDDQYNLYAYVGNDPVNLTDPDGRAALAAAPACAGPQAVGCGLIGVGIGAVGCMLSSGCRETAGQILNGPFGRAFSCAMGNCGPAAQALLNEASPPAPNSSEGQSQGQRGCIYCVPGTKTPSGRDYIGRTDNLDNRRRNARDGRDRRGAQQVGSYPNGDRQAGRNAEQREINRRGGPENLDNGRNEVAPKRWPERGIQPPRRSSDPH